jgi:hypothetical protein
MELSKYIVGEDAIIMLIPRFVKSTEVSIMIFNYLIDKSGVDRKIEMPPSDIIHLDPESSRVFSADIYIFKSLVVAAYNKLNLKQSVSIILLEWGYDQDLLEMVRSKYQGRIRVLRLDFMHEPRIVNINTLRLPMETEFSSWYHAITNSHKSPVMIRSMSGNHFYRDMSYEERFVSLKEPNRYSLSYNNNPLQPIDMSEVLKHVAQLTNDDLITHPAALMGINHYKSGTGTIKGDSPKIHAIAEQFVNLPGKYLVVTSFRFAYGAIFISNMLNEILGVKPTVVTSGMDRERMNKVFDDFNNLEKSHTSIIVTSEVPIKPLKGIARVIIMDTYDVSFIINILHSICGYKCGSIDRPLQVTLLAVKYPSFLKESTFEEEESTRAINELSSMEMRYQYLLDNAIPVILDETSWEVRDNMIS